MTWLNIVSKYHDKWILIVQSYGEQRFAEDIVQDMYLKLHRMSIANTNEDEFLDKVLKNNKEPNGAYIRMVLFTLFIDLKKEQNKLKETNIEDYSYCLDVSTTDFDNEQFEKKLEEEKQSWYAYDRILFDIYTQNKFSMRDIANGTGIPLKSIFLTINKCKDKIRENLEVDYKNN